MRYEANLEKFNDEHHIYHSYNERAEGYYSSSIKGEDIVLVVNNSTNEVIVYLDFGCSSGGYPVHIGLETFKTLKKVINKLLKDGIIKECE